MAVTPVKLSVLRTKSFVVGALLPPVLVKFMPSVLYAHWCVGYPLAVVPDTLDFETKVSMIPVKPVVENLKTID
jgi:hypothetical protein